MNKCPKGLEADPCPKCGVGVWRVSGNHIWNVRCVPTRKPIDWPLVAGLLVGGFLALVFAASLVGCSTTPTFIGMPKVWRDKDNIYTISQRVDWCRSATKPPTDDCHSGMALPATPTATGE